MVDEKKNKAAAQLGKLGGAARTEAKIAAAKVNGAKGGRPPHLDLSKEQLAILGDLVSKDRARLVRNQQQDPNFNWQGFIDNRDQLLARLQVEGSSVSVAKDDLIGLIQLIAPCIASEEKAANKTYSNPELDATVLELHKIGHHIDSLVSPPGPSIFEHYVKEARGRF